MKSFIASALAGATLVSAAVVRREKANMQAGKPFDGLDPSITTIAYDDNTYTVRTHKKKHSMPAFQPLVKPAIGSEHRLS